MYRAVRTRGPETRTFRTVEDAIGGLVRDTWHTSMGGDLNVGGELEGTIYGAGCWDGPGLSGDTLDDPVDGRVRDAGVTVDRGSSGDVPDGE